MNRLHDKIIREVSIFIFACFFCLFFAGCAGQQRPHITGNNADAKADAPQNGEGVPSDDIPEGRDGMIVKDETGSYRIIPTKFGYVKGKVEYPDNKEVKPEILPVGQDRKASAKKENVAASPAPEIRREEDKTEKPHIRDNEGSFDIIEESSSEDTGKVPRAGSIILNFDDADILEVVRTMAELLNFNYLVGPGVQGKVTIHTAGELDKEDLFPIFSRILGLNGLAAVKHDGLYTIAKLKDIPRMSIAAKYGTDLQGIPPGEMPLIQVIPLKYISAEEMAKLVTPFISPDGTIVTHKESNTLIVADKGFNILKALRLAKVFDINVFREVKHRFFPLRNMDVEEAVNVLKEIFSSYATAGRAEAKFISIEHLNMVLVISSDPQVLDQAGEFITRLDADRGDVEPRIYVYFVKNGEAEQLSDLLNKIFTSTSSDNKGRTKNAAAKRQDAKSARSISGNPLARKAKAEKVPGRVPSKVGPGGTGSGTLRGEVSITPDEVRNAIIIEAVPSDYHIIEGILNRIDVLPRQVLIECTIAEIRLDNSRDLGIDWSYSKGTHPGSGLLSANVNSDGFNYTVGIYNRVKAQLSAFAKAGKVNIISSPHVLASDNKEAKIDISDEIPVASSSYEYTSGESPVVSTNIEYRDTGVILSVTPHINEFGLVTMDIEQEVSEYSGDIEVAGKKYPSFFKRRINTSLTVKHGQTIVLGGLIKDKNSLKSQGTPWLVNIPIIRYLFGKESDEDNRSELIVLLSPRVIISLDDVEAVTKEFKSKVRNVVKILK